MEAPTDVQKLIEQVQLLLAQSAAQNERIAALEADGQFPEFGPGRFPGLRTT